MSMGMSFKDLIREDVSKTFMNPEEFGELHILNGVSICLIIDNNEMVEREKRYAAGTYKNGISTRQVLFYVTAEAFGPLPQPGRTLTLDKQTYVVTDAISEGGIYSVSMEAAKG